MLSARKITIGLVLTTALMILPVLGGSQSTASAAIEEYCLGANLGEGQDCRDSHFRPIVWSRVIKPNFEGQACTGAYNSNNVEIGGWTCTTTGLQATNFYDGSRNLRGTALNNFNVPHLTGKVEY